MHQLRRRNFETILQDVVGVGVRPRAVDLHNEIPKTTVSFSTCVVRTEVHRRKMMCQQLRQGPKLILEWLSMAVGGCFQCRAPQRAEDDGRPDNSADPLDDDILEAPLKVQLAEVRELSEIWLSLP